MAGNDKNTLLLLHGDSIRDASQYSRSLTNSGAVVSTAQSKFGNQSLYFDGSSKIFFDQIDFGSGDFTIDWWEYVIDSSSECRFCSSYTAGTSNDGGILVGYNGTGVYASSKAEYGSWDLLSQATMLSNALNQWVHWALVRSGNALKSYRNGVLFATYSLSGSIGYGTNTQSVIGDYRAGDPSLFKGYIAEFRISDVARWSKDFIPPDSPYTCPNPSVIHVLDTPGKTIAARVKAVDSNGAESDYTAGETYSIIFNASPTISGEDMDLGQFSKDPFRYSYTVDDRDASDIVTVTEKIIDANGMETILRTYEAVKGEETAVAWTPKAWLSLPVGTHKLIITAEDGAGGYVIRALNFTRSVDEVSFYRTVATDAMAYKAFLSIFPTKDDLPMDCIVSAEITNNPFDAVPVWEDISDALNSKVHTFANDTAANGYGIGYRIRLDKDVAKVWAETVVIRFA